MSKRQRTDRKRQDARPDEISVKISFMQNSARSVPTCPGQTDEWGSLSQRIISAFEASSSVSESHPAGKFLQMCNHERVHEQLKQYQNWSMGAYTRTLVLDGKNFNVQLLCWPVGTQSPIHAHSDVESGIESNCFMMVLQGELVQTLYPPSAIGADRRVDASHMKTMRIAPGEVEYINDSVGVHRVGNGGNSPAVSLHVYAPGWVAVELFEEGDAGGASFNADFGDF